MEHTKGSVGHHVTDAQSDRAATSHLVLDRVSVAYGPKQVTHEVSLTVGRGEIVALLGHNGAGKTSTLAGAFGGVDVTTGSIRLGDDSVALWSAPRRVKAGLGYVPAVNFVFAGLSVVDNLKLGCSHVAGDKVKRERRDRVFDLWPILAERAKQDAGTLSGGQRRMLSVGIALMAGPQVLMLDEPSLGLSPKVVDDLFDDLKRLATDQNLSILLVEQAVTKALHLADWAYVMKSGRVISDSSAADLRSSGSLWGLF